MWGTYKIIDRAPGIYRFIPTCVGNMGISRRYDDSAEGFIPTCVGNISKSAKLHSGFAVHLHVCGEHLSASPPVAIITGSSPRVWGTSHALAEFVDGLRFIPTCVGNILSNDIASLRFAVHPHVCGEHLVRDNVPIVQVGSSPRVWGTWFSPSDETREVRFIPTCVGNINKQRVFSGK